MGSQGAAIDFPNDDQIEERLFPGQPGRYGMLPYGQEYVAAPPATMGPYYATPTTAAPYAAPPALSGSYARPPNPAIYQPAPAPYQPAVSAPVYPPVYSPATPMATASNSYSNNYSPSASPSYQYSTTTAAPYSAPSTPAGYSRPSNQAAYQTGPPLPSAVTYATSITTHAPVPYQGVYPSVSASSVPMAIAPNSYSSYSLSPSLSY